MKLVHGVDCLLCSSTGYTIDYIDYDIIACYSSCLIHVYCNCKFGQKLRQIHKMMKKDE